MPDVTLITSLGRNRTLNGFMLAEAPDNMSRPFSHSEAMSDAADAYAAQSSGRQYTPTYPILIASRNDQHTPNMANSLEEQRIRLEKEKEFAVKMNDAEWMIERSKKNLQLAERELEFAEKVHAFRRIEREFHAERSAHAAEMAALTEAKNLQKDLISKNHDLEKEVQDLNQKLLKCQQENEELRNELENADNLDERVDFGLEQLQQHYPDWQQNQ